MGNKLKAICSSDECLSDDVPLEEREISKLYPTVILKSTSSSMFESESGSILQEHNICLNGRKFKKLKA